MKSLELAHFVLQNLVNQGVREFCLCAGARNSPLVLTLEKSKELNLVSNKIKIFSVPIFKLRLGDFMIYTVAHIERHVVQAQKVLMEDNFP